MVSAINQSIEVIFDNGISQLKLRIVFMEIYYKMLVSENYKPGF